jgi:hypothetical protein
MVIDHGCQQLEPQHNELDELQTVTIKRGCSDVVNCSSYIGMGGDGIRKIGYLLGCRFDTL